MPRKKTPESRSEEWFQDFMREENRAKEDQETRNAHAEVVKKGLALYHLAKTNGGYAKRADPFTLETEILHGNLALVISAICWVAGTILFRYLVPLFLPSTDRLSETVVALAVGTAIAGLALFYLREDHSRPDSVKMAIRRFYGALGFLAVILLWVLAGAVLRPYIKQAEMFKGSGMTNFMEKLVLPTSIANAALGILFEVTCSLGLLLWSASLKSRELLNRIQKEMRLLEEFIDALKKCKDTKGSLPLPPTKGSNNDSSAQDHSPMLDLLYRVLMQPQRPKALPSGGGKRRNSGRRKQHGRKH